MILFHIKKMPTFFTQNKIFRIFLPWLFFFSLFLPASAFSAFAQSPGEEEFIKAGFLYKFTKFISWPKDFLPEGRDEFVIGVLGKSPLKETMDILFAKKKEINGKKLVIKRFSSLEEMRECHILFVSISMKDHFEEILKKVKGLPILVVGDTPGFAQKGASVNFFIQKGQIRFEFNTSSLKTGRFEVDSLLLDVGRIVD